MENIKIDEFLKYKFLSSIKYNQCGEKACFVVHESDCDDNNYKSNLWVYKEKEKSYEQLTSCGKVKSFMWSEYGEHIIFSSMRSHKDKEKKEKGYEFTQFYKISTTGGEAVEEFRVPLNVTTIKQLSEDTYILTAIYNSNKKELYKLNEEEQEKELKHRKEEKDYEVLEEIPFWSNGSGFTNRTRNRLYLYNIKTKKLEPITEPYLNVHGFELDENKKKVIINGVSYKDMMDTKSKLYLLNLNSMEIEPLIEDDFDYGYATFIEENKIICTGSDTKDYGINENKKFYTIDISTKNKICITPDFESSTWNSVGSDCRYGGSPSVVKEGEYVYFITTEIDSSYINRIDKQGNIKKMSLQQGSVDSYTVYGEKILFIGMRDLKLQELYKLENEKEQQITLFNEWIHENKKVGKLEKLTIESEPGVNIDGWIIKPTDFVEGEKYPAILDIHGGPKTVYGEVFYHEMQYWANEGYVVFFCNPRGSDGKDNKFADIRGKYGTVDYEDIMRFTDAVLDKYSFIDKERVGVTGGSYGGFMTNWIIGHTDRFKAAASQRSISNWISKFCTTDIGYYFVDDQNGGTPWNNHEKLWFHSPLKYADKVKTPTLFIHSEEDYRCWVAEGLQMFTALKYHGVESRLCMFREENHELSRSGKPKHRLRRLQEITDWFNHYLK